MFIDVYQTNSNVSMAMSLKVTRPNRLTNDESLTSFEDWKNNITFYLTQDKEFAELLKETTTWTKSSDADTNRGRGSAANRQTLDRFLGLIASLAPPLLFHEIIDDTTGISDVFRLLRNYYSFSPSESTFMKYYNIKREVVNGTLERPLHLFLRMKQFIRDNLLLSSGKIEHDGKVPTTNETLSPTTERLNVLRWLYVLHPNLPMHVSNVYSQELQTKSLKDLQPRICEQVDDLLRQVEEKLETNEGVSASYSRFNRSGQYQRPQVPKQHSFQKSFQKPRSNTLPGNFPQNRKVRFKACDICKSLNLPFVGHDTHLCPNVSPDDRASVMKSFSVDLGEEENFDDFPTEYEVEEEYFDDAPSAQNQNDAHEVVNIQRVSVMRSPAFNCKVNNNKLDAPAVLDSGATGSMMELDIVEQANIRVYTQQAI